MISYKHCYPFRLGTTSFIYPADYITNVDRLGPYLDEIELLLFESQDASLPSKADISRLKTMARDMDLTYNVHLPLDLDLSGRPGNDSRRTIDRLAAILDLVSPLSATTHTLHLEFHEQNQDADTIAHWQTRTSANLTELLAVTAIDSQRISIETLDYPPQWFSPIVDHLNLAVCMDIGHILRFGFNLKTIIRDFNQHIQILHLHGVIDKSDHKSIATLDHETRKTILAFLKDFDASVSLEVFSLDLLEDSLTSLAAMLPQSKSHQSFNEGPI